MFLMCLILPLRASSSHGVRGASHRSPSIISGNRCSASPRPLCLPFLPPDIGEYHPPKEDIMYKSLCKPTLHLSKLRRNLPRFSSLLAAVGRGGCSFSCSLGRELCNPCISFWHLKLIFPLMLGTTECWVFVVQLTT